MRECGEGRRGSVWGIMKGSGRFGEGCGEVRVRGGKGGMGEGRRVREGGGGMRVLQRLNDPDEWAHPPPPSSVYDQLPLPHAFVITLK